MESGSRQARRACEISTMIARTSFVSHFPPRGPLRHHVSVSTARPLAICSTNAPTSPPSTTHTFDVFQNAPPPPPTPPPSTSAAIIILPAFGAPASDYTDLSSRLQSHFNEPSPTIKILPTTRRTWLRTLGGRPITPILDLLDETIAATTGKITLIAHSASGWIARIYLGHRAYEGKAPRKLACRISTLLCLGTPHRSDEAIMAKNMNFVNTHYPCAHLPRVRYLNFIGDGASLKAGQGQHLRRGEFKAWLQRLTYSVTDGNIANDKVIGDGIVPLSCAFLHDAECNARLQGVVHAQSSTDSIWYGHPLVLPFWASFLVP